MNKTETRLEKVIWIIVQIVLLTLCKRDKKDAKIHFGLLPEDDSLFPFLHYSLDNRKTRGDRVLCYPVVKYPNSYMSPVLSIRKQQQLDTLGARDYVDAVSHSLTAEERESLMCQERQRLRTFELGWSHECYLPSREMAKAGFYCLNDADKVQCVFCRGVLHNWLPGDRPMEEHSKHFRNCKLVRGQPCGNIPYSTDNEAVGQDMLTQIKLTADAGCSAVTAENLGINTHRAFKPEYAAEASRIRTFSRFPASCPVPAEKICEAGFYYTGFDDTVKCFWCEGGLEKWVRGDNPWIEHSRHFPACEFVISVKVDFVMPSQSSERPSGAEAAGIPVSTKHPGKDNYAGMISTCLSLGYPEKDILKVIRRHRSEPLSSAKELLQVLYDLEDENPGQSCCVESEDGPADRDVQSRNDQLQEASCLQCGLADVRQSTHIGLPCGCLILCDDCSKKGVPVCCPKCLTSLAGLMRVFLA